MATTKVLYGQEYVVNRLYDLYGHIIGSNEHCMEVSCYVVHGWQRPAGQPSGRGCWGGAVGGIVLGRRGVAGRWPGPYILRFWSLWGFYFCFVAFHEASAAYSSTIRCARHASSGPVMGPVTKYGRYGGCWWNMGCIGCFNAEKWRFTAQSSLNLRSLPHSCVRDTTGPRKLLAGERSLDPSWKYM